MKKLLAVMTVVLAAILAISITDCGGSSSMTSMSGVFSDAPIAGLSYTCGSTTGTTGTGGTYACPTGSTVTFTVGGITICTAPVQAYMTPVSCAQAGGNPTANASTPSVEALAQFLISIGTPAGTAPGSLTSLTITSAELTAASAVTLNFATATQTQLQTAVTTINPGQTLASPTTAQNELTGTITTNVAGTFTGTYSGNDTGTWSLTIASNGSVTGSFASTAGGSSGTLAGALANGTTYTGTFTSTCCNGGNGTWSGTVNTAKPPTTGKGPYLLSGTWDNTTVNATGAFTN